MSSNRTDASPGPSGEHWTLAVASQVLSECDGLVVVDGAVDSTVHGTIVEILDVSDEEKRQQLARHAIALWLKIRQPVDVLVLCPDQATADFYAQPIVTSLPGYVFTPRVVGPAQVPVVKDPAKAAASPAVAVLSVAMHGEEPGVCEAFVAGLASVPPVVGASYFEIAYAAAGSPAARRALEILVSTSSWLVSSPFAKEHFGRGKAEGLAEGEAEALLAFLRARGLKFTAAERARITGCTDLDQLRIWVTRGATVTSVPDLFR